MKPLITGLIVLITCAAMTGCYKKDLEAANTENAALRQQLEEVKAENAKLKETAGNYLQNASKAAAENKLDLALKILKDLIVKFPGDPLVEKATANIQAIEAEFERLAAEKREAEARRMEAAEKISVNIRKISPCGNKLGGRTSYSNTEGNQMYENNSLDIGRKQENSPFESCYYSVINNRIDTLFGFFKDSGNTEITHIGDSKGRININDVKAAYEKRLGMPAVKSSDQTWCMKAIKSKDKLVQAGAIAMGNPVKFKCGEVVVWDNDAVTLMLFEASSSWGDSTGHMSQGYVGVGMIDKALLKTRSEARLTEKRLEAEAKAEADEKDALLRSIDSN